MRKIENDEGATRPLENSRKRGKHISAPRKKQNGRAVIFNGMKIDQDAVCTYMHDIYIYIYIGIYVYT